MGGKRGGSSVLAFVLASGVVLGGLAVAGNLPAVGVAVGALSKEPVAETLVTWDCLWDPTINDDWHDDVLCVRGDEWERPLRGYSTGEERGVRSASLRRGGGRHLVEPATC
jgi:hypothetical protein